jgi:hypothetical protein
VKEDIPNVAVSYTVQEDERERHRERDRGILRVEREQEWVEWTKE